MEFTTGAMRYPGS